METAIQTKRTWQTGEQPTEAEMKEFCRRFSAEEWASLIKNDLFVRQYDKDLNLMAVAAEMILNEKPVFKLKDIKLNT